MSLDVEAIVQKMMSSASTAFGEKWSQVEDFAESEFKALATSMVEISRNVARHELGQGGYDLPTGKALFRMHRLTLEQAFVAVTAMVLVAVQSALDAILGVLAEAFSELVDLIL
ncbi:hypothetical protein OA2633_10764 [Oceanicaulis alexandrii HTCC2633]|jgi:hypothetical protein|uniref:hypothetical protein n=1 Tax=Oceanicaulis sp. HTCC2633 TaxID=314254 RepID=UPI000066D2FE|nr:hypothetical protein [Oceanicaulis sp. HTCC2633]EAP88728.1 hypothetical protein OA2633_10764 [Oceanicaulis alexandrii HTCC2633] [Oceanicaulis sp. HTCC2633]